MMLRNYYVGPNLSQIRSVSQFNDFLLVFLFETFSSKVICKWFNVSCTCTKSEYRPFDLQFLNNGYASTQELGRTNKTNLSTTSGSGDKKSDLSDAWSFRFCRLPRDIFNFKFFKNWHKSKTSMMISVKFWRDQT